MQITATTKSPTQLKSDCLIIPLFEKRITDLRKLLDNDIYTHLHKIIKRIGFSAKLGETATIHTPQTKFAVVILVGAGGKSQWNSARLGRTATSAMREAMKLSAKDVTVALSPIINGKLSDEDVLYLFGTAVSRACYRYDITLSKKLQHSVPQSCVLYSHIDTNRTRGVIQRINAMEYASKISRDLANLPGNICTPSYIVNQARKLGRSSSKIRLKILRESDMERLGMGAFLSVSRGSQEPGFIVCIEYKGAGARQAPVALVGKGITFDTGGISIKPSATMDEMKFDMSGSANVLGALAFCAKMRLKLNVIGVLACAENMPGGRASKPGDIVKTMSGQTVEILNTDAEGRLVLCDALTYVGRYKPECVIDIATLTGACVVALGQEASGVMGNNQTLIDELLSAGKKSGDRAWQLPMWDEYQPQLKSNFADIANIGGRWGGTITAACFLSRFAKDYRWAHLDIAGTAWFTGANKGSTGRPLPLLTQFLIDRSQ